MKTKKLLLTVVAVLFSVVAARAQVYIGGKVHLDHAFAGSESSTSISMSPDIGYSFGDFSVGVTTEIDYSGIFNGQYFTKSFSLTPYVEYYYWSSGRFSLFLEAGLGFNSLKHNQPSMVDDAVSWSTYIAPGFDVRLSDHWSVLGYLGNLSYDFTEKILDFAFNEDVFAVGLYYSF